MTRGQRDQKGKFEQAMEDIAKPHISQIILNFFLFSGIAGIVLFVVAVGMRWIKV
jgi:hypothetical protein